MVVSEGVSRAPGYAFHSLEEAVRFVVWALSQQEVFRQVAESTTHHGRLLDLKFLVEGNQSYVNQLNNYFCILPLLTENS